jgi:mRNA interferase MazF
MEGHFVSNVWLVKLVPDASNGLTKTSAVDTLQLRGVDTQRFRDKLGALSVADMRSIVAAIAGVIEF